MGQTALLRDGVAEQGRFPSPVDCSPLSERMVSHCFGKAAEYLQASISSRKAGRNFPHPWRETGWGEVGILDSGRNLGSNSSPECLRGP